MSFKNLPSYYQARVAGIACVLLSALSCLGFAQPEGSGTVTFKVGGEVVTTDVWTFARFNTKGDHNFTTNMHKDPRTLLLNLGKPAAGVSLQLGPLSSGNYGTYFVNFGMPSTSYEIESGTFTFTEFDPIRGVFSATFEATAKNADGVVIHITDGVVKNGKIGEDLIIE